MARKTLFIAAVMLIITGNIYPQSSRVIYFMKMPQSHLLNPAIKPANTFYIGLPALSGITSGLGNNFFEMTDLLIPDIKAESNIAFEDPDCDLNALAAKLNKSNTISTELGIQLLGISFPVAKKYSIFFDVIDRITVKTVFPKELMDLYVLGPANYLDKPLDISKTNIKGFYYREYGLGFSGDIIKNLRIGAKVKLLSGLASMSLVNDKFLLEVNDAPTYTQTVTTDATMDVSGKETINKIFVDNNFIIKKEGSTGGVDFMGFLGDYLGLPLTNVGLGIDIGAVYTVNKIVTVSASITDLGFIKWKNDLKSYESEETFTLPGITFEDVVNQDYSFDIMIGSLVDTIQRSFKEVAPKPFTTNLPFRFIAGASFNVLPILSLGILSESRVSAGNLKQSFVFSGNIYAGKALSASLSYTIANDTYNNLGLGIAVKAGPAQIYLIADKIPMTWDKYFFKEGDTDNYRKVSLPRNIEMINFQLGLNIVFGKPVTKKTDVPMLIEQK